MERWTVVWEMRIEKWGTYLEACEFFLSFREPREFDETVESFLVSDSAPCTPYRTNDSGFIATLRRWEQHVVNTSEKKKKQTLASRDQWSRERSLTSVVHFLAIHRCRFVCLNYFVSMCRRCPCADDVDCRAVCLCRPLRPQYSTVRSRNHGCHLDRMRRRHIGMAMLLFGQQHYKYCQCYRHVCLFWFVWIEIISLVMDVVVVVVLDVTVMEDESIFVMPICQ